MPYGRKAKKMNFIKKTAVYAAAALMLLTAVPFSASAEEKAPDPIAWYTFDDANNFGKDKMGKYDMTCHNGNGTPKSVKGAVGKAIELDGDYCLALPKDNDFSGKVKSFTIAYYAKRDRDNQLPWETPISLAKFRIMHRVDEGDNDFMHVTADREDWWITQQFEKGTFSDALNLYTLTIEVGGGKTVVTYYLNGVKVGDKSFEKEYSYADGNLTFAVGSQANADGWYYGEKGHCFKGVIDEVRVWDKALTAEQVSAVAKADKQPGGDNDPTPTPTPPTSDGVAAVCAVLVAAAGAVVIAKKKRG